MGQRGLWLLADFQYCLINALRGVPDAQGGHGLFHFRPPDIIVEDTAGGLEQRLAAGVLLQQHRRAARMTGAIS